MINEESIAPTTLQLQKKINELEEEVAKLVFRLGGLQAEYEQLNRQVKKDRLDRAGL